MCRSIKEILNDLPSFRSILSGLACCCTPCSKLIKLTFLGVVACALISAPRKLIAQENIRIIHSPHRYEDVPAPGELFKIQVSLQGSREVHPNLKLVMLMDGKLIEYPLGTGKLNSSNEPEFELLLPAPEAELSYQFILPMQSGGVLSSSQFNYRRQCAEKKGLTVIPVKEKDQGVLFKGLSQAATDLEYEVRLYRTADDLLQKIKNSMRTVPTEDGE